MFARLSNYLHEHRKAILGGLTAGVAMLLQVQDHGITMEEWLQVAAATLAGAGIVWVVPNRNYAKRNTN